MAPLWVTCPEIAKLSHLKRQSIHEVVKRSFDDPCYSWKGAHLLVRRVRGRGGNSGWLYEVEVGSLPSDLQTGFNASESPVQLALMLDTSADSEAGWKEAFLRPATRTERGTVERREAIRKLASAEQVRDGRRVVIPERTIQRWMERFDRNGLAGLRRRRRDGAGEKIVTISRAWDAATTSLSNAVRNRIAAQLAQHRRNLWGNGASYIDVKRLASEFLADATVDAGISLPDAELRLACELPKHVVEIDRDARDVHEFRTDRKSWDDKRPRMQLTSAGLRAMQVVYSDMHHFDIYLEREDGSLATPKGIAWMDAATGRIRMDIKLCAPGTSVRNADLIDSFISMTQDPYWGMPEALYLDNGSEYRWAEFVKDALTLTGMRCFTFGEGNRNSVTRAQAYNAAAKGLLEGSFRVFEETLIKVLPGYIGGNRMNSRKANVGQAPDPWPGTFEMFCDRIQDLMRYWMTRQRQGDLKGKSPQQVLASLIEGGWERTDVDPYALAVAFSTEAERKVVDGKVSGPGGWHYCDELIAYTGQKVGVRIPKYQSWGGLPVFSLKTRALIGIARHEQSVDRLDPAGAEEAARRKQAALSAIRAKAATVETTDVADLMAASGKRQPTPAAPKSGGMITLSAAHGTAGRQMAETPGEQHDREHAARQAEMRERLALAKSFKPKVPK